MISKLHYISQGDTALEQEHNIRKVLDNGGNWIQLRWKNARHNELLLLSQKIKKICESYKAALIINDEVQIAKNCNADGVHLGLTDECIANARAVLGYDKIIGGTANTLEDVLQRTREGCNYIGLGPYRFTTTKEKLSPVLGVNGYQSILHSLQEQKINYPPILAIGGITTNDIKDILNTGIYGVAVSGLLTNNPAVISKIQLV